MNTPFSASYIGSYRRNRRGTVAVMLVLVLVLLVGTFAVSVCRRSVDERRNDLHHHQVVVLQNAIECVTASGVAIDDVVRLPLDTTGERWVVVKTVTSDDGRLLFQATSYRNDQAGFSIRRPARIGP